MNSPTGSTEPTADAESERDCTAEAVPAPVAKTKEPAATSDAAESESQHAESPNASWRLLSDATPPPADNLESWRPLRGRWSIALERAALTVERPINGLTTTQLNPLYHTGTIAFFLLLLVGLTGLYLFFFFQYGYDSSYNAVARVESQFIGRTIRAIHRYASGALVITTLLHAYRMLFLERFRGPRWLAWVSGIVMTVFVWLAGTTGYGLVADIRAQELANRFAALLDLATPWSEQFKLILATAGEKGSSWAIFLVLLVAHVALWLILIGSFVIHIKRLKRPRWLPPAHWIAGVGLSLLLLALLFPAGLLSQANLLRFPGPLSFDPFFLAFLPFRGAWWLWLTGGALMLFFALLPWLTRGRSGQGRTADGVTIPRAQVSLPLPAPVHILKDRCTGCTKCAIDCPYGAITMVERHDGKPHKYIAIEDPSRCVSCGICVGSCDLAAVTLGPQPPESLWGLVAARMGLNEPVAAALPVITTAGVPEARGREITRRRVVYTCERHAIHGARDLVREVGAGDDDWLVIPVPCAGAVAPDLMVRTLTAGAAAVKLVGCPLDDCANREGSLWSDERLNRRRVPRLRRAFEKSPITADWLPPDEFRKALTRPIALSEAGTPDYAGSRTATGTASGRHFATAFALLVFVLLLQVLVTDLPFTPNPDLPTEIRVAMQYPAAPFGTSAAMTQLPEQSLSLQLLIDGEVTSERDFTGVDELAADGAGLLLEQRLSPGAHEIEVRYLAQPSDETTTVYKGSAAPVAGDIFQPDIPRPSTVVCPAGSSPQSPLCMW